jgi:hypothetical protein
MEMQISGVSGLAVEPKPRRGLPALPTTRTAEPRSTRFFRFITAMGDLRRSKRKVYTVQVRKKACQTSSFGYGNNRPHYIGRDAAKVKRFARNLEKKCGEAWRG